MTDRERYEQWKEQGYRSCHLCPRECGADRWNGQLGRCRVPAGIYAARAALHMWEEPCLSDTEGSGTVFFSGCSLGCVYCQNHDIAAADCGREISEQRLADIFLELQEKGANNINLVTPTHYLWSILPALDDAKNRGLRLPVVYNTSGYEKVETLRYLDGVVDVYLPDFKYWDPELAARYSAAPDYPEVARAALAEMVRQTGDPVFDEKEHMTKGVIVRHLQLPGYMENSRQVIRYLYETYGDHIFMSIMNQYTPMPEMVRYPELNRRVTGKEYDALVDYAIDLGVENGFIQDGDTAEESFIPAFDYEGI